jgi:transcriptional regulator with XRE-family HTH domain
VKTNRKKKYSVLTELIYRLRTNAGITQKDLANLLNEPQSFVSKVETGERRIDVIELAEICKALNSNIVEFIIMLEKELNETTS